MEVVPLLFAVLFHVGFTGFLRVMSCMVAVTARGMGVMGGLFVLTPLVMFGGLGVVSCRVSMMLCCLFMVFCCFFGHGKVLRSSAHRLARAVLRLR